MNEFNDKNKNRLEVEENRLVRTKRAISPIIWDTADCETAGDLSFSSRIPSTPTPSIRSYRDKDTISRSLNRENVSRSLTMAFDDERPRSPMTHFEDEFTTNGSSGFKYWRWHKVEEDHRGGTKTHNKKDIFTLNVKKGELVLIVDNCSLCRNARCPFINVMTNQNETGSIEKQVLSRTPVILSCKVEKKCENSKFLSEDELADHYIGEHFYDQLRSLLPKYLKRCPVYKCNFRSKGYKDLVYHYGGKPDGKNPIPHRFILSQIIIDSLDKQIQSLRQDQDSLQQDFLHLQTKIEEGKVFATRNKVLEDEIQDLHQDKENLEKELHDSKMKFEQNGFNKDKQIEKWIDYYDKEKENELLSLRTKVDAQQDEIFGWKNRFHACQDRVNHLINVSARDVESKDKVIQDLQEKVEECTKKDEIHISEKNCLEQKLKGMQHKDKKLHLDISDLRESLRSKEADLVKAIQKSEEIYKLCEKIEELKSTNMGLCKEKGELQHKDKKLHKDISDLRESFRSKEADLVKAVQKSEETYKLREKIEDLKSTNVELCKEKGELQHKDKKLHKDISDLRESLRSKEADLVKAIQKSEETYKLREKIEELKSTNVELCKEKGELRKNLTKAESQLGIKLSKHIIKISEELKQTEEKRKLEAKSHLEVLSAKQTELNSLAEKFKSVSKHYEGKTKNLQGEVSEKREKTIELRNSLLEQKKFCEEVKAKLELALSENKTLKSTNKTLQKANENLVSEKMQLEKSHKSLTKNAAKFNELKETHKTVSTLTLENNKLKKEIEDLLKKSKDYIKVCSSLKEVKEELQICKKDFEESNLSKDSAMLEVQERDLSISKYKSTVQDLNSQIVELSEKEKEFEEVKQDLEATRNEVVEAQIEVQHREEEIEKLKESLTQTESTRPTEVCHNKCEKEIESLLRKNSFLRNALEHRNKELNTLLNNNFGFVDSTSAVPVKRERKESTETCSEKRMKTN